MARVIAERPAAAVVVRTVPEATAAGFWTRRDMVIVTALMTAMLLRGVLIGLIVWPWYAPDEPDHTELAILTGAFGQPADAAAQHDLRFAIAQSQYEWHVTEQPPKPDAPRPGVWAGQVGRQPLLYYVIAGWASRLATGDIVSQLGVMRLVSAAIGALTVGGVYVAGRLIAPRSRAIALAMAGVALFQTALGLLAGAVTNDILAVAAVTWVLVACLALARASTQRGLIGSGLAVVATLAAALLAKRTTVFVVMPILLAATAVIIPRISPRLPSRRARALAVGAVGLAVLLGLLGVVGYDEQTATGWAVERTSRVAGGAPGYGRFVLRIGDDAPGLSVRQTINGDRFISLRGQPVSAGAWLRLDDPTAAPRPAVARIEHKVGGATRSQNTTVTVGPDWTFARVGTTIDPAATTGAFVVVATGPPGPRVLVDGATLVAGNVPGTPAPGPASDAVTWNGEARRNLLDNSSFEERPFGLRPVLRDSLSQLIGRPFDLVVEKLLATVSEPVSLEELRLEVVEPFLVTLFGRPGRTAELNLPTWWYASHLAILLVAIAGLVVGAAVQLARRRVGAVDWLIAGMLTLALLGAMVVTLGPYVIGLFSGPPFGRYLLPALVPLAAIYALGLVGGLPGRWRFSAALVLLLLLATLDTYALLYFLPNHFAIRPPLPG